MALVRRQSLEAGVARLQALRPGHELGTIRVRLVGDADGDAKTRCRSCHWRFHRAPLPPKIREYRSGIETPRRRLSRFRSKDHGLRYTRAEANLPRHTDPSRAGQ